MKSSDKIDRNQLIMTSIDDMIDENSNVRVIDAYVKSLDVKKLGYQVYTNKVGRPAYDPRELIGLYLYSYMSKVMSSRMMEQQTYINIEIMWLLNGAHPDHSTIAAFRSKNAHALTNTFHDFTETCIKLKLIEGTTVSIDGTKIRANNNKKRNFLEKTLLKKIKYLDEQIAEYLSTLDINDSSNGELQVMEERKSKYENMLEQLRNSEETQISTTDPDSRLMDNKKGGLDVAYNIQATVDSKNLLVVDQYVTNAPTDQGELYKAASRAKKTLSSDDLTVLADKGYYNGEDLDKCLAEEGITPIVARQDAPTKEGRYSIDEYTYNEADDSFTCPQNQKLTRISSNGAKKTVFANKTACKSCPYKSKCFKQDGKYKYRRIIKDKHYKAMFKANRLYDANKELYRKRQEMSEHIFGSIKRQLGFPQLALRTKPKVEGEVSLLFLGYNLKRVMNIMKKPKLIEYFKEQIRLIYIQIFCFSQIFICYDCE